MEGATDNLSVVPHANHETVDIHRIIHRDDASGGTNFRLGQTWLLAVHRAHPVPLIEISICTNKTNYNGCEGKMYLCRNSQSPVTSDNFGNNLFSFISLE